jgi:hypothetical protein
MLEVVRRETRLGGHGRVVVIYVTIPGIHHRSTHHIAAHHIPVIYVARGVDLKRVIRGVIHVIVVRTGIEIQKNLLETRESEDLVSSELPKSGCLLPMASEKVLMTQWVSYHWTMRIMFHRQEARAPDRTMWAKSDTQGESLKAKGCGAIGRNVRSRRKTTVEAATRTARRFQR